MMFASKSVVHDLRTINAKQKDANNIQIQICHLPNQIN